LKYLQDVPPARLPNGDLLAASNAKGTPRVSDVVHPSEPNCCLRRFRSSADSIHSSEYPQPEQRKRVTGIPNCINPPPMVFADGFSDASPGMRTIFFE